MSTTITFTEEQKALLLEALAIAERSVQKVRESALEIGADEIGQTLWKKCCAIWDLAHEIQGESE